MLSDPGKLGGGQMPCDQGAAPAVSPHSDLPRSRSIPLAARSMPLDVARSPLDVARRLPAMTALLPPRPRCVLRCPGSGGG
jgi:hypothetical protein